MTKRVYKKIKPFFYLVPVVFLFALGVLFRSAQKSSLDALSIVCGCDPLNISGNLDPNSKDAFFEGKKIEVPQEAFDTTLSSPILGMADPDERYIEVDLSEQKIRAWNGAILFLESPVSTGLPGYDTPTGEFRIWMKIRATRMSGGQGRLAYDLPNVPYVMFFGNDTIPDYRGYGLHGTYWHNDFGKVHSHGCVNLPTPIAKKLYEWTNPVIPEGKNIIRATDADQGTRIVIHG